MVTCVSILVTILIEICRGYNLGVALHGMEIVDTLANIQGTSAQTLVCKKVGVYYFQLND